jgi:hypothetical protein
VLLLSFLMLQGVEQLNLYTGVTPALAWFRWGPISFTHLLQKFDNIFEKKCMDVHFDTICQLVYLVKNLTISILTKKNKPIQPK